MPDYGSDGERLLSITDGVPPRCRMQSAIGVQNLVQRFIDNDNKRSKKRSEVDGLVDGNAPYNSARLRENGRADAANFNDGSGRAFLESGAGALYDLVTEAPGNVQITTSHGNDEQRIEWSRTMSGNADIMFATDKSWDSQVLTSQNSTVNHGHGPLFFDDPHCVLPRYVPESDLLVPDLANSDLDRWEIAVILFTYYPPELWQCIQNESAAEQVGWQLKKTKLVIEYAMDQKKPDQRVENWEWYQNLIKTNSFDYVDTVNVCRLAHVYWKEFDGRITHAIVEQANESGGETDYLFLSVGRYDDFYQVVHPMFFDKGRDGLYHTVTGLGVKMFGMMSYKNRLFLNLLDKSFAPKTLFKPTTAEAQTRFQLTRLGDYAVMPPGVEVVQAPIQGFLTDGLAMHRATDDILRSNLSQYRQQVQADRPGNPDTALEVRMKASQQGSLSNTVFSRYYKQLDLLYAEIVRRLCNLNSTDPRAKLFQERCQKQGVPRECFGKIENVVAVRVLGGGSPLLRKDNVSAIGGVIGRCSEEGQFNWLNDYIAAHVGQPGISRYNPRNKTSQIVDDQKERALNQVTNMRIGAPPAFSPSQDPLIFCGVYLQACTQAIGSLRQGADPRQVLSFVDLAAPAAMKQVQRMSNDPTRKQFVTQFGKQIKQLQQITEKIRKMVADKAKQAKGQQQKTQAAMSDQQIKAMRAKGDLALKSQKQQHGMALKTVAARQNMVLNDLRTSSEIRLNHMRALNE